MSRLGTWCLVWTESTGKSGDRLLGTARKRFQRLLWDGRIQVFVNANRACPVWARSVPVGTKSERYALTAGSASQSAKTKNDRWCRRRLPVADSSS